MNYIHLLLYKENQALLTVDKCHLKLIALN